MKKEGFTIVEMLVATILITLLIGIALFSFRFQLLIIGKTKDISLDNVLKYTWIKDSLESIKYYVVDEYDMLGKPMKRLHFFFEGNNQEITYITTNSVLYDEIALAKLFCQDDKMIYKEEPLYGDIDFLRPSFSDNFKTKILYKNIRNCNFKYLIKSDEKDELSNYIPDTITIDFIKNEKHIKYFINVKSDFNDSLGYVNDDMYPQE